MEWIQEQWSYRPSLVFFYECLKYTDNLFTHGKKSWDEILMSTKANFKIAFKYQEIKGKRDEGINFKMYYENTANTTIPEHRCPNHSLRRKRAISKMKSYLPARIFMDHPPNYELINYVSSYIKKHDY